MWRTNKTPDPNGPGFCFNDKETMRQLITPNPNIPCKPGWCLEYVRRTFGLPARYLTATEAWENSTTPHRDRNFPAGVAVPVYYGLAREPAGHIVLRMPDGSVYSTSDNSTTPHHHPNIADLESYYAGWGWPLTYRGWSEDVANTPVVGLDVQTLSKDEDMPITNADAEMIAAVLYRKDVARQGPGVKGVTNFGATVAWQDSNLAGIRGEVIALKELVKQLAVKQGAVIDYTAIAKAVNDDAAARLQK